MNAYVKREYKGTYQLLNTNGYFENSDSYSPAEFDQHDAFLIARMLNHYATYAHYSSVVIKEGRNNE